MSSFADEAPDLIQTKLHRPRLGQDLISRPHLIERLNRGLNCKLTLISAQAGAGKSILLAQWLRQCPQQSAWLSLDEDDNNLMVFVRYLCAAIQTVFPEYCNRILDLLSAPLAPPPRVITTSLINELVVLCNSRHASDEGGRGTIGLIIAFDDYHNITEPTIHELVSQLVAYMPQCVHLAMSTRTDPPLPLARLRARGEMTELRTNDLRLTAEEAGKLLELTAGRKLNDDTIIFLRDKTEGWAVGLRLAALSIRDMPDEGDIAKRLEGTSNSFIVDYMMSEVLSQQSSAHQDFLLRSSILNRFNAELCEAVLWSEGDTSPAASQPGITLSRTILTELKSANLFLLSLDREERWFRYHHLFRDLLLHRLQRQHEPEYVRTLHSRASQWFEDNGFIEEALSHAFSTGDLDRAARIVARRRYALMNQARWQRLARYFERFPPQFASQQPDLLMLKSWLFYHQGHYGQLPAILRQLEVVLSQMTLGQDSSSAESIRHLNGEISALKSLLYYYRTDVQRTIAEAEFSIENTPPELWIVRILARIFLAGAYQMKGDLNRAYMIVYQGVDEEVVQSNAFKATILVSVCSIYWVVADLPGLRDTAHQCLKLYNYPGSVEIRGYAHYHLACAYYHLNDLIRAEEHFTGVVQQPYLNYGDAFAHSAFGLSLTYQAQNRPEEAHEVLSSTIAYLVETGNTTLLPAAYTFQAELALRQGQLGLASQWADQFDTIPPLSPLVRFYQPHFTLVKIWLAQDTPALRQRAAESLVQLKDYAESTHNTVVLIKALALLAIVRAADDDESAALSLLEKALQLAQPGGVIRLFIDLGSPMIHLLQTLRAQSISPDYLNPYLVQILAAFDELAADQNQAGAGRSPAPPPVLVEPLTAREMEVLELLDQRLTNKEIAEKLIISPDTVKSHTLGIYAKLDVHGRRQAVDKAREIGLLSSF